MSTMELREQVTDYYLIVWYYVVVISSATHANSI